MANIPTVAGTQVVRTNLDPAKIDPRAAQAGAIAQQQFGQSVQRMAEVGMKLAETHQAIRNTKAVAQLDYDLRSMMDKVSVKMAQDPNGFQINETTKRTRWEDAYDEELKTIGEGMKKQSLPPALQKQIDLHMQDFDARQRSKIRMGALKAETEDTKATIIQAATKAAEQGDDAGAVPALTSPIAKQVFTETELKSINESVGRVAEVASVTSAIAADPLSARAFLADVDDRTGVHRSLKKVTPSQLRILQHQADDEISRRRAVAINDAAGRILGAQVSGRSQDLPTDESIMALAETRQIGWNDARALLTSKNHRDRIDPDTQAARANILMGQIESVPDDASPEFRRNEANRISSLAVGLTEWQVKQINQALEDMKGQRLRTDKSDYILQATLDSLGSRLAAGHYGDVQKVKEMQYVPKYEKEMRFAMPWSTMKGPVQDPETGLIRQGSGRTGIGFSFWRSFSTEQPVLKEGRGGKMEPVIFFKPETGEPVIDSAANVRARTEQARAVRVYAAIKDAVRNWRVTHPDASAKELEDFTNKVEAKELETADIDSVGDELDSILGRR